MKKTNVPAEKRVPKTNDSTATKTKKAPVKRKPDLVFSKEDKTVTVIYFNQNGSEQKCGPYSGTVMLYAGITSKKFSTIDRELLMGKAEELKTQGQFDVVEGGVTPNSEDFNKGKRFFAVEKVLNTTDSAKGVASIKNSMISSGFLDESGKVIPTEKEKA